MINAEFLASCTDEQINKGIAWLLVKDKSININSRIYTELLSFYMRIPKDYCTNPSDIMPIAIANVISIETFDGSTWWAEAIMQKDELLTESITSVELKNPYRAICEVYILMSVNR